MGNSCCQSNEITVATLNFSGINVNRFEYHDGSVFYENLDKNFKLIQEKEMKKLIQKGWEGAIFDKHYKKKRFTVLFGEEFLNKLKQNKKLFTREKFNKFWMQQYKEAKNLGFDRDYQPSETEIKNVQFMDYMFYKVLVMTVYQLSSYDENDESKLPLPSRKLEQKLQDLKDAPAFSLKTKQQLVEKYYEITDVMFLQEAGSVKDWKNKKYFSRVTNHDSVIIYRTAIFGESLPDKNKKWEEKLNINNDTAFVFTDKGFLLISSHFKSNQLEYLKQTTQMETNLRQILKEQRGLKLILGMDANHFVSEQKFNLISKTFIVPKDKLTPTSIKKRTYIQAQIKKAGLKAEEVKDHIVSTLPINQHWIELMNGNDSQRELLPNNVHPYDHFIVKARLSI